LRSNSKTRGSRAVGASYIEPWQRLCKRILQLKLRIFLRKTKMPIYQSYVQLICGRNHPKPAPGRANSSDTG